MSTVTLSLAQTRDLIKAAFIASQTSEANAISVADALTAAEALGQTGHGLRRVSAYCAQARSGKVDGFAEPATEQTAPSVLLIDAANGFAYPAIDKAMQLLPPLAHEQGIAMTGIRRSHHCGVMGLVVERLADAGLVALMVANTPAAIAPWGGRTPLFGTNPIAFAAPLEAQDPLVVDLSLSRVARGKIMAAKQKGEAIPEGWALDAEGNPTTDPEAALAGTMVPLGEAKGTALALMVEMLSAGLIGANYAYEASSFFDAEGPPPGVGQTIIAISPERFGGVDALGRFAEMAEKVSSDPGARLPGRRRQSLRGSAAEAGIEADAALIAEIEAIAAAGQTAAS
jgi:(2R)-3-sulfolactate dehydrogenase (NADP+)